MGCKCSVLQKEEEEGPRQETETGGFRPSQRPSSSNVVTPGKIAIVKKCHHVYDGDTLTLDGGQRVRFLGIDTPEIKQHQPFAIEARDFVTELCAGKELYLEHDGQAKDHYGRLLAYVFVKQADGTFLCVNEAVVRAGFAGYYHPGQKSLRHEAALRAALKDARDARRGQWAAFVSRGTVYATRNGKAYHKHGCRHLHNSKHLKEFEEGAAIEAGLSACRTCLAD
uniref:TNase-like domain-containing protein n=1 Tax=Chromera velia CCMP2878 TaxID=1169474 RepID=A0A0G4HIP8_9ALVE|mmetsp:Transcript_20293/g.40637  ORF Transcript_20293/g.40637 Transcript_20293/m.40637 type:complete len:225 (+) Transcript_20293:264-938(+)|eukprot:Cvel_6974.t1-p1 / transcript=Cvel_6974.t1 / gene=Cvel_6974 / organism=Chromera_velia_CCMP2878 / gene_product=Thermonuclease, putative / transcript_product=Thermonuclease, putative / location=Cvel_scaffold354:40991-41662(+) / protein_length=224 / sequence_SO=supercontig / SO=protein_coding / is_pseudo=false